MISKFFNPKNDVAFKHLFGSERNKDILISFLNDVLPNKKVVDVQFLATSQDPEAAYLKQSVVDVLCTDQDKSYYIIEMQVAHYEAFIKRAQYYAAKAYTRQLKVGQHYRELKEVIFIAITDFIMFPDKPGYKSDHVVLDGESHTRDLTDFSYTFIELPKFKKTEKELKTNLDKWCYFFINTPHDNSVIDTFANDILFTKCLHELEAFYWTDEELEQYEREDKRERDHMAIMEYQLKTRFENIMEEGIEKGIEQGIEKGIEQGIEKGVLNTARNLKKQGVLPTIIMEATGLSLEEIDKL